MPQIRRIGSFLASLTLMLLALMQLSLHVFGSSDTMVLIVVMADVRFSWHLSMLERSFAARAVGRRSWRSSMPRKLASSMRHC